MMNTVDFATVGLRLIGLTLWVLGSVFLLGNILESAWDFNPNYMGYYFMTQLLRPALFIAAGALIHGFSRRLGKRLAK